MDLLRDGPWPARLEGVLMAVVAAGVATAIGLAASLEERPSSGLLYLIAVCLATYLGGLSVGLLAAAISYIPYNHYFLAPSGSFKFGEGSIAAVAAFAGAALLVIFLVGRERRARKTAETEQRFGEALEQTETGSWEWDVDKNEIRWSENLGPIHGLARGEQPGGYEEYLELIYPEDRPKIAAAVEAALASGADYEIELRTVHPDGEIHWLFAQASVVTDDAGRPIRLVGLARDVTDRKREEERESFLASATETLAGSLDYEETLGAVAQLALPTLADWCAVDLVGERGELANVAVAHADEEKLRVAREMRDRFPPAPIAAAGAMHVVQTGRSELYREVPDELLEQAASGPEALAFLRGLGLRSAMVVPLRAGARTLGALTFVTAETARRYDEADLALAEELARRAAIAIENARLHQAEQEARAEAEAVARRMERLQRLTARLSAAATPAEVADVLVREGTASFGAVAGWVSVLSESGDALDHLASFGYEPAFVEQYRRIPLDAPLAVADVARSGKPVWLETTSGERRPELVKALSATGGESLAILPIGTGDKPMGFMALRFSGPRSFPEEERRLLVQLARQYSETLERARLFDSERRSRELVTRLQEVTAALSAAATREEVVDAVIDVAIPALDARTGVFGVVEESELAVVRSAGYEAAPFPERLDLDDPWPIADAVRRKTIVELETVADRQAAYGVPDEVWAVSGQGALIAVPLLAGDRAVGAIGFTRDEPGRMTLREAIFVGSLAGQAALALERAGLYETERRARDDLARLQGVTAALSAAADVGQVVEAVLDQALPALQARAGALLLVDEEGGLELVGSRGYEGVEDLPERVPLDSPLAAARAVRGQEIVVIESDEERRSRYELSEAVRRATGDGTLAAVPLVIGGRAIGSFGFSLEEQRSLTDEECAFLLSLGRQAAQAVERARLFEGEQAARREAEEASMTLRALQAIAEIGLTARTIDDLLEPLLVFLRDAVGADRAWLLLRDDRGDLVVRAAVGLDESTGEQAPVPWGEGIAGRIAAGGQPLIVDDVIEAPPVSHVRDAGGSLVGVPLRVGTETIGVLSVGSERKTAFRLRHVSLLEAAAARVALAVERTTLFEREHEVAVTLQRSVLPETVPQRPGLAVGVRYVPGASGLEVGGDWYDAIELDSGELGLVVGDVVGKGVVAAATMAQLRNALRVYALEGLKPASVVARLNRLVETTGPSFATLVYATLDPERRVLRYASAGHPPPVLVRSSGEAVLLEGGRSVPLGVLEDPTFRQEALALEPGDTLVLYTDGLVERREASLEESLQELLELAASPAEDVEELLDRLLESLAGDEPADDVAMLAVSLTAERQRRLELRVPSRPQSLVEIRHQLQAWLVQAGADEGERHEILLACSEACANAIEHAQQPTRDEIEVSAELADGEVLVGVRDFGRWLDPPAHGDRGVGLRLVREMMDSVDIVRGDEGTEVRLRRRLLSPVPVS